MEEEDAKKINKGKEFPSVCAGRLGVGAYLAVLKLV